MSECCSRASIQLQFYCSLLEEEDKQEIDYHCDI